MPDFTPDGRLPPDGPAPSAETWNVAELLVDPLWHAGIVEIGGQRIPVLGVLLRDRWEHFALSPASLGALRTWIASIPNE